MPSLPTVDVDLVPPLNGSCNEIDQDTDSGGANPVVPTNQSMPTQRADAPMEASLS